MKKLFTLSLTMALFLSAVSCGKKSDSSTAENAVPDPMITQTMYKEERLSLPEEIGMPRSMHVSANGGIKVLYEDNYNKLRVGDFTSDLSFSGSYAIEIPGDTELDFIDFNPDGTVTALLMHCTDFQKVIDRTADDEDISFIIAEYDADLNLIEQKNITGIENYYSIGDTFFQSFSKAGEDYILCTNNNALKIDSSGKVTAHADVDFNNYYISASDGHIVNFNNHTGYGFADSDTLAPPSSPTPFDISAPIQRPPFPGDDEYLCYIVLKDGYYGLTKNCRLQKIIDFASSLIDAGSIFSITPMDKGKYLLASSDTGGSYLSLLTVRPDDFVDDRKTVIVGMHNVINQSDYELANEFARGNDDYKIEYRQYDWTADDLRDDILTGNAPDMFIGFEDDVYRYTNLGAFMGLDELHEKYGGLSRDDLLPNIAESYTLNGDIYGMPLSFGLDRLLIAKKDLISRDYAFWNFDQFLDIYNSMPEDMYLTTQYAWMNTPDRLFGTMRFYDEYIDFDNASCDFDNSDFIRQLEFCKSARLITPLPDSFYSTATPEELSMSMEENTFMLDKGQAMLTPSSISSLSELFNELGKYHLTPDETTFLITPSNSGCGYISASSGFYSIIRNGKCTDGAWAFLNYLLDYDRLTTPAWCPLNGFPVTNDAYNYWINAERDSLNEQKEITTTFNGYEVTYSTVLSDESFEYINELLTTGKASITGMNDELQKIITDETDYYFNDECSAEQCAEMLDNRVSIFLSERS